MNEFPHQPLSLVTIRAGGGVAMVANLIAQGLADRLGQRVDVDNRETTTLAAEFVARAPADGHTLLHLGPSVWTTPLLKKVPYDPLRDFAPVSLAIVQPNVLVVHPSVAAHSVQELIDLAAASPGKLAYASGMAGASSHIAGALFAHMAGVDIVRVPYKNTPILGVESLLTGKVQMMLFSAASAMRHARAGRLRALAVTSARPSELVPELPPIAATLPGYESVHVQAVYVPAGTPASTIERLNREIVEFLNTADAKQKLFSAGVEVIASTAAECAARIRSEQAMLRELIDKTGIKPERSSP